MDTHCDYSTACPDENILAGLYNYRRMSKFYRVFFIIASLAALVICLLVFGGYWSLAAAEAGPGGLSAAAQYETAARLLPWRADLYEQAALSALDGQDAARAIALFGFARQKGALSASGQLRLGDAYLLVGKTESALAEWQGLLNDDQARGEASQRLVEAYFSQNQFEAAETALRQWLDFNPGNPQANYRLGLLRLTAAAPDARDLLETAANGDPQLAGHANQLIAALDTAAPDSPLVYRLTVCGRALAAIDEWILSQRTFARAANLDAEYAPAWAWLGESLQHTGDGDAIGALQKAVALSPDAVEFHAMLGLYWQRKSDWAQARAEFIAAARLEPKNPFWQMTLGELSAHLDDLVQALTYYQAAVQLAPDNIQTWRALALFCAEHDASVDDVGLNAALQAFALEPESPQSMDILGRVLMAAGETASAEAMFKKALVLTPQDPALLLHLGLLYLETEQLDLAQQFLRSAWDLDPSGPSGTRAARILESYFP
jgi:tetratricopeptide (TPR) repeat protein